MYMGMCPWVYDIDNVHVPRPLHIVNTRGIFPKPLSCWPLLLLLLLLVLLLLLLPVLLLLLRLLLLLLPRKRDVLHTSAAAPLTAAALHAALLKTGRTIKF
ncbi:unnamed protein product [Rangifer tarandus platyrhynchus]|uniref:Uncharacterized protein n=1 Tax=Rangifer tarandus platyrhynchus TaxID=3082113 RepID=A0ABN8XJ06_RANTA|nr:unnamed protein product [Rangifer tarandus platyrhynchus]